MFKKGEHFFGPGECYDCIINHMHICVSIMARIISVLIVHDHSDGLWILSLDDALLNSVVRSYMNYFANQYSAGLVCYVLRHVRYLLKSVLICI